MNTAWRPQPTPAARDFHARYAGTRAATLADVWRLAGAPTARFIARHSRALAAGTAAACPHFARAYRERIARA